MRGPLGRLYTSATCGAMRIALLVTVELVLATTSLAQSPKQIVGRVRLAVAEAWEQPGKPAVLRLELTSEEMFPETGYCLRTSDHFDAGRWRVAIIGAERCSEMIGHMVTPASTALRIPVQDSGGVRLELSRGRDTARYDIQVNPRYVIVRTDAPTGFTIPPTIQTNRITPQSLQVGCLTVMLDAGACRAFAIIVLDTNDVEGYLAATGYSNTVPPYHHPFATRDSLAELGEVILAKVDSNGMARVRRLARAFTGLMHGRSGRTRVSLRDWLGRSETCTLGTCTRSP
jgi:hypothetical protein